VGISKVIEDDEKTFLLYDVCFTENTSAVLVIAQRLE